MNKARLLKLAKILETVPRERFNMAGFHINNEFKPCGFAGCAMGWAATSGKFKGLKWDRENDRITFGKIKGGFDSAEALFELGDGESGYLFTEQGAYNHKTGQYLHETPKQVARRIRKFVRDPSSSE